MCTKRINDRFQYEKENDECAVVELWIIICEMMKLALMQMFSNLSNKKNLKHTHKT